MVAEHPGADYPLGETELLIASMSSEFANAIEPKQFGTAI
jgi:hypothetical protein